VGGGGGVRVGRVAWLVQLMGAREGPDGGEGGRLVWALYIYIYIHIFVNRRKVLASRGPRSSAPVSRQEDSRSKD